MLRSGSARETRELHLLGNGPSTSFCFRVRLVQGPLRARRNLGAHVRIIPELLSTEEMADLFRFSTAFATASRGEGYCLPAVQAMSAGKPALASGWSSFADLPVLKVAHRVEPVPQEVALPGYST